MRALSFNGLANAFKVAAINGGAHTNPFFAGDTIYAWSEVQERMDIPGCDGIGALRLRTVASKNRPSTDYPDKTDGWKYDESVVLDFDYTVLMPCRARCCCGLLVF